MKAEREPTLVNAQLNPQRLHDLRDIRALRRDRRSEFLGAAARGRLRRRVEPVLDRLSFAASTMSAQPVERSLACSATRISYL
ncbi:MAG TPA: hypothetical protein VFB68_00925 [Xanthobacteraceae bacterium]|nr:hypothetical protein [Xanthobacteraceae bacterium]